MRSITVATTDASGGATYSGIVALDTWTAPVNASIGVTVTGTVNYTVQYTLDNIMDNGWTSATGIWWNFSDLAAKTGTLAANLTAPASAVRVVQNTGDGSTSAIVLQAGGNGVS
jgi:hypothetical protein